jgi:phosphopentomutase
MPVPPDRRAFVVVLDACGVGALPDASEYGDAGSDTLGHLAETVGGLRLPTLQRLGLGNVAPIAGVSPVPDPVVHGRLHRAGPGKDSTTGHWELMGVVTPAPLPTYPDGFPDEIVARLRAATGYAFCANAPLNGMDAIDAFAAHHLETGELILYTSQDSVLQVAAHEDVLDESGLYAVCERIRAEMTGEDAVGRVIARPFRGAGTADDPLARTHGRRDLSIAPPGRSALERAQAAGVPVHTVGKAGELMAGVGVDVSRPGPTNAIALAETDALLSDLDTGFVLVNLVDTDQLYGHRKDAAGFAVALERIDAHVAGWLAGMRPGDLLVLTADHGCDVVATHSDHTREHVPLLAAFAGATTARHDGPMADVGTSVLSWLGVADTGPDPLPGHSFLTGSG